MRQKNFVGVLVLGIMLSVSAARAAAFEQAVVDRTKGKAEVVTFDGGRRPAAVGDFIFGGEIIETGADGQVRLVLGDGSVLMVSPKTRVEVTDERTRLSTGEMVVVYMGRLWCQVVKPSDGGTSLEVVGPTAVAGVRGTEFEAGVGLDGSTRVGVTRGAVEVASAAGRVEIGAGRETTVDLDAGPAAPAAYAGGNESWRQWALDRQDRIIKNGDRIVPRMVAPVRQSRAQLRRLRQDGNRNFSRLRSRAERRQAAGRPALGPAERQEVLQYLRETGAAVRQLYLADRQLMARWYLLRQIREDVREHPDLYKPGFAATLDEALAEFDRQDVAGMHAEDGKIIEAYIDWFDHFQAQHRIGRYRDGAPDPEARREQIRRARQNAPTGD